MSKNANHFVNHDEVTFKYDEKSESNMCLTELKNSSCFII